MATDPREVLVRRLFALQQIANTLSDQSEAIIRSMFDEIVAEIAKLDPTGVSPRYRQGRLDRLDARVREVAGSAYDRMYAEQRAALASVGASQAQGASMQLRAVLGAGNAGRVAPTTGLGPNFFKAVVDREPVQGALLKDWFKGQAQRTQFQVGRQVRLGMVGGETIDDMVRRVRGRSNGRGRYTGGVMQTSTREATAIIRTAVNDISNTAMLNTFEANADILAGVTFTATLDARTSSICQATDSKTWKLDDPAIQRPPLHINCRSVLIPEVDWKGLGMEPPPEGTRASAGGQVPASTTYEDWLRSQDRAMQDEILGPGRAQLFRDGKVGLRELVTADGRRIPLDALGIDEATPAWQRALYEDVLPRELDIRDMFAGRAEARAWREQFLAAHGDDPEVRTFVSAVDRWVVSAEQPDLTVEMEAVLRGEGGSDEARSMLRALSRAQPAPSLHRGVWTGDAADEVVGRYPAGRVFDMRASSFTSDARVADTFASWGEGEVDDPVEVLFRLERGARAVKIENLSVHTLEREWYTGGRFEVVSSRKFADDRVEITIRQVGTFDV